MKIDASGGFGIVSKRVLTNPDLSIQAKATYSCLASYASAKKRETWVSVDTLAKDLGASPRSVKGWLAELVAAEVITRTKPGHAGRRSVTTILRDWVFVADS